MYDSNRRYEQCMIFMKLFKILYVLKDENKLAPKAYKRQTDRPHASTHTNVMDMVTIVTQSKKRNKCIQRMFSYQK